MTGAAARRAALALGAAALAGAALAGPVRAEPGRDADRAWTFNVYFENDLFADTDANYTNGVKLSWSSPDVGAYTDVSRLPRWTHRLLPYLPFIHRRGPEHTRNVVLAIGQNIYTPQDTSRADVVPGDRPYAGWLYVSAAFQNRTPTRADSWEVQLGVVGPLSLAEQAQLLVHDVRGLSKPKGWSNQLDNEPGLNLVYERKWRTFDADLASGLGFDVITHLGGSLGNVQTYANAGAELRVGWNLPSDFGNSLIRPAGDTSAPLGGSAPPAARRFGLHAFASVDGRAVLHDIFLDGNTFSSSHSVDKRPFVADLAAGVSVVWGPAKLTFAKVVRTREHRGQPREHRFGSVSLAVTY